MEYTHFPPVKEGRIVGFFDGWIANRKFPVDMAGFAVTVDTLRKVADGFQMNLLILEFFIILGPGAFYDNSVYRL